MTAPLVALILLACPATDTTTSDTGTPTSDTGTTGAVPELCDDGAPVQAFDPTEPESMRRWQPAGDFSVPLRDGSTWTLSEHWTGCDTYVFLPHWWTVSELDGDSWWTTHVDELLDRSPLNVHYFFVVYSNSSATVEEYAALAEQEIELGWDWLDSSQVEHWQERVHVVNAPLDEVGGLVDDMSNSGPGTLGWGIDRQQRLRSTGYPPDVEAYDSSLNSQGLWPWENELYSYASEPKYWNYEAQREVRIAEHDWTEVPIFTRELQEEYADATGAVPDAATMAGFDTLWIDVQIECPDEDSYELSNCGAWDYLAYTWLYDEAEDSWHEMARYITTYHRESRWVVDASHALAWLQDGGERTFRFQWAPSWNTQPSIISMKLMLSDTGKGHRPVEAHPLFTGGSYSETFHDDRPPVDVDIPADAAHVAIVSIATGHGADTGSCSEFCDQTHTYAIGDDSWTEEQIIDSDTTCRDDVPNGTVPNQAGTWWFDRAGWCPGREVYPFVADVTDSVTPGSTATVSYTATVAGGEPESSRGNVELRSWLVVSE